MDLICPCNGEVLDFNNAGIAYCPFCDRYWRATVEEFIPEEGEDGGSYK